MSRSVTSIPSSLITSLARKNRKSRSANWRKLVKVIENGNRVEAVESAKRLINLRLRQSVRPLVRLLQKGRTAHVRENACYALGWMGFPEAIRISVGTAEENDKCLLAMARVILKRAGKGELAAR